MNIKKINNELVIATGAVISIVIANYVFTENLRQDIKADVIRIDEKHEEHRKTIDERWASLLQEIHSQDKKIWELDKKIEQSQSFEKEPSR
jgi:peptidoglycan hydrolase CwlO-like protein